MSFRQDTDGNGTWEQVQARTAHKVSDVTKINNTTGTAWPFAFSGQRPINSNSPGPSALAIGMAGPFGLYHDPVAFLNKCRSVGVFDVPVGELEFWVPVLVVSRPSKKNKAEWADYAANRIREIPSRLDDVWALDASQSRFCWAF